MLWALDTETTGLDFLHGCKPFLIAACSEGGDIRTWEWPVDPFTREPTIPPDDIDELTNFVNDPANHFVFHNTKFDVWSLASIGIEFRWHNEAQRSYVYDPIEYAHPKRPTNKNRNEHSEIEPLGYPESTRFEDTLVASHILSSKESHGLKDLAMLYLGIGNEDEKELQKITNRARDQARRQLPDWRIANRGDPHWPGIRASSWWKFDTWLPAALVRLQPSVIFGLGLPSRSESDWGSIVRTYAIRDVERTMGLWELFHDGLDESGLWELYKFRRSLLPILYQMERVGVTINRRRLQDTIEEFTGCKDAALGYCYRLVGYMKSRLESQFRGKPLNLNSSQQLQQLLFDPSYLGLEGVDRTTTGWSTGAPSLRAILAKLGENPAAAAHSTAYKFLESLLESRRYAKAVDYLESYQAYATPPSTVKPAIGSSTDGKTQESIPPSAKPKKRGRPVSLQAKRQRQNPVVNPETDSYHLRLHGGFNLTGADTTRLSSSNPNLQNIGKMAETNLRSVFGPQRGRQWFAFDYSNIELRIFAYASGDQSLTQAFEQGESVHMIVARVLYPDRIKAAGSEEAFRKTDYYRYTKNFNFALIYGAGARKADETARVPGAYASIRKHFPLIDQFLESKSSEARRTGKVVTLGGYPLEVPRNEPYKACNYFVQGSAGMALQLAMLRIHEYLSQFPGYHLILSIHDELVFDFPAPPPFLYAAPDCDHLPTIKSLMESSGKDLGPGLGIPELPLPVECEWIPYGSTWATGAKVNLSTTPSDTMEP